jgi:hypothetical protein
MTLRSSGPSAAESSDGTALGAVMIGAFSVTPMTRRPPAVLAKATIVLSAG